MSFAATSFAETSFCADIDFDVVGTFPIFPFNKDILKLVMSLNSEADFSFSMTQEFEHNLLINTGIDTVVIINTQYDYPLTINTGTEYKLVR